VALGRERAAVLAASPPSSQPPAYRAVDSADGSGSSASRRVESADRADQRDGKANKDGESRGGDKAGGRGKDKPSKGKGNDKWWRLPRRLWRPQ
jgi:hypothetical protein